MTAAVPLDVETFTDRLARLRSLAWGKTGAIHKAPSDPTQAGGADGDNPLSSCDALMVTLGNSSDYTVYQKTTALFSWLLGYEFPETVMVVTKKSIAFLASQRKGVILDALNDSGANLAHIFKREKGAGVSNDVFSSLYSLIQDGAVSGQGASASEPLKIGVIAKDKNSGPMIDEWLAFLTEKHSKEHTLVDAAPSIATLFATKDARETQLLQSAAELTKLLMTEHFAKTILSAVDEGKRITHMQLSDNVESFVADHIDRLQGKLVAAKGANLDYVDVCYPPIIQSGGSFSLKPSTMSNDQRLSQQGPVICAAGLRYRAYCANMARTILLNPTEEQEQALVFLQDLQKHLARLLSPGVTPAAVYEGGLSYVRKHRPQFESKLPSNFGFGMSIEFRQPEYVINSKCHRAIPEGMTFNLTVGLQDLGSGQGKGSASYALMISDTIQVVNGGNGATLLTEGLATLSDVSYIFKKESRPPSSARPDDAAPMMSTRLRNQKSSSTTGENELSAKRRREHQKMIGEKRIKEALERYGAEEEGEHGRDRKALVPKFESYRKDTSLPKEVGMNNSVKVFLDKRAETVLIPVSGLAVPFHINTIKNISKNDEGDFSYLRINFVAPGRSVGKKDVITAALEDPTAHFIRGLTVRTADTYHAQEIFKGIQEMKKISGEREAARKERADLVEQGALVEVSGKRPARLVDVFIRPGLDGKRLPGDIEIHSNGLRYRSQLRSDQRVDILFANVKHFFFQPCDHETVVIVHIHLHHPVMVGKKKTSDIQFYREALESVVDETSGRRTKMRFGDEDEIAQEREERRRRSEANEEFRTFAERVVEASRGTLEVDIPFRDLGFTGVPHRQNVLLQPTTDCLVHLVEQPFFIVTLADIEVAFLERVVFGLKNFDLAFVFKDHSKAPVHISTIPMAQLAAVKEWLDSVDVYFVESKVNFNWSNIMKTVNEDPVGFYEMGGWMYLQPESANDESDEDDGSSEYEPEESGSDDDAESSEEDDEEDDYEESSEEDDEEDDEEDEDDDAPDWDELEEKARREDERSASMSRRQPSAGVKRSLPQKRR